MSLRGLEARGRGCCCSRDSGPFRKPPSTSYLGFGARRVDVRGAVDVACSPSKFGTTFEGRLWVSAYEFENENAKKPKFQAPNVGNIQTSPLLVDKVYSDEKMKMDDIIEWIYGILPKSKPPPNPTPKVPQNPIPKVPVPVPKLPPPLNNAPPPPPPPPPTESNVIGPYDTLPPSPRSIFHWYLGKGGVVRRPAGAMAPLT